MRSFAIVLVLGCGSPAATQAPSNKPVAPAIPADQTVYCDLAVQMIDELVACKHAPGDSFDTLRQSMNTSRSLDAVMLRKNAAYCAFFLEQVLLDPDGPREDCKFTAAPRLREFTTFLDGYYAERTQVTPTGDERRDRALRAFAKHRDEICACADYECTRRVEEAYLAGPIEPVGGDAPAPIREIVDKLFDEVARCSNDMRFVRKK